MILISSYYMIIQVIEKSWLLQFIAKFLVSLLSLSSSLHKEYKLAVRAPQFRVLTRLVNYKDEKFTRKIKPRNIN